MSSYRIAVGYDVPLSALTPFEPSPRNGEATPSERQYSDGGAGDIGLYSALVWDVWESPEAYQAVLEQCGLLAATTCQVTLYTRNEVFEWVRYNGIAVQPELPTDGAWSNFWPRDFRIYVHSLVALLDM